MGLHYIAKYKIRMEEHYIAKYKSQLYTGSCLFRLVFGTCWDAQIRHSSGHGQYFTAGHAPVNQPYPLHTRALRANEHGDDRRLVAPPAAPEATAHRCHAH